MNFKENLEEYLPKEFVDSLIDSMQKDRTNSLVLNTNKISNEKFEKLFPKVIKNSLIKNAYFYDKNVYDFGKSFYFNNGLFYIMDTASMLTSFLMPINDGDNVLDMCAAPGGKTIFLALKNRNINIISNDLSYERSLILSSNIEKMGLDNVIVCSNTINTLEIYYKTTFDKIILDAPCSGSAMFRKNSEMESDWNYSKVLKCSYEQSSLLDQAANMLKPGGIISYSTCSFSYEEDEKIIIDFLNKHKEFKTIKLPDNKSFYRGKNLPDSIHIFPNIFEGEGQFICQLKKEGFLEENNKLNVTKKYNEYGFKYQERINDKLYVFNNDLNLKHLTIIRKGLLIGDYKKDILIPSFHYAHYLSSKDSIALNDDEIKKYLHGEELTKETNLKTGFYPVSYQSINLGFVHVVGNKLKNLYPKGLRH